MSKEIKADIAGWDNVHPPAGTAEVILRIPEEHLPSIQDLYGKEVVLTVPEGKP